MFTPEYYNDAKTGIEKETIIPACADCLIDSRRCFKSCKVQEKLASINDKYAESKSFHNVRREILAKYFYEIKLTH